LLGGLLLTMLLAGCGLRAIKRQSQQIEALGEIRGHVELATEQSGPCYCVLLKDDGEYLTSMLHVLLPRSGKYGFFAPPGRYVIGAFVDANRDGDYQLDEPAAYVGMDTGTPARIVLPPGGKVTVDRMVVKAAVEHERTEDVVDATVKAIANIGKVATLADPIFSRESASMGYWRPVDYLQKLGGGLFMLQEYEGGKTPVVFVHGANGTALDFEAVIASLDRGRFQPWVLQYPSGIYLEIVSNYLLNALTRLETRHHFDGLVLVAHSMGGLVARSFVMRNHESGSPVRVLLAMTINSPLQGMRSAQSGVAHSPIVLPSWRDVAYDSEFVRKILGWPWPKEVPYHLAFSFEAGKGSDGVVALDLALPLSVQAEATRMRGFVAEHTGVLRQAAFLEYFKETLARIPLASR
jgi:pimeloyl-ACP methyl ester carboxylesterase